MTQQAGSDDDNNGLLISFYIDNGELDAITRELCFVLGYEFSQVTGLLLSGLPFTKLIHAENVKRIAAQCQKENRQIRVAWCQDDQSESWVQLDVYASPS